MGQFWLLQGERNKGGQSHTTAARGASEQTTCRSKQQPREQTRKCRFPTLWRDVGQPGSVLLEFLFTYYNSTFPVDLSETEKAPKGKPAV